MSDSTATACEQCPCGRWISLRIRCSTSPLEPLRTGRPIAWKVTSDDDFERMAELMSDPRLYLAELAESSQASRMTFTAITVCDCGRRYRALDERPWIVLVPGDETDSGHILDTAES